MNIIKLKDIIMPSDNPHSNLFNKYLKGKYAYWVQMRYIVSFDHMRHEGYVACEEDITKLLQNLDGSYPKPYGAPSIDVYEPGIIEYIDTFETDKINSTIDYRIRNKYVTDEDITIDEVKVFRSWLAKELLKMDQTELGEQKNDLFDYETLTVLNYYANDMYDSTVKSLSVFGTQVPNQISIQSSCSCHQGSDISSLYKIQENLCDSLSIYRKNIYLKMTELFSNIDFWTQWSQDFIGVFKRYIDNIISLNLPLSTKLWHSEFEDCSCKQNINEQEERISILKDLSKSLEYIMEGRVSGHKNYINDSLYKWSSILYEIMKW